MTAKIVSYLESLKQTHQEIWNTEWHCAELRAEARNRQRKHRRWRSGKTERTRKPAGLTAMPDRVKVLRAHIFLEIAELLLGHLGQINPANLEDWMRKARSAVPRLGTERRNRRLEQLLEPCLGEVFGRLSQLLGAEHPESAASQSKSWDAEGLYEALGMRAQALKMALPSLATIQGHDRLAATIYLREYARWAALDRFVSSNHLMTAKAFLTAIPIILDQPDPYLIKTYGKAGWSSWQRAIQELRQELAPTP